MKKLVNLLIVLLILYFGIEILFVNLNKGHIVEYKIKDKENEFLVKEIYTQKQKNEKNNYYFEIKKDDLVFNFQTYEDLKKANYVIKNIEYFENDNYKCIYLTSKSNLPITDVICSKENIQYYYHTIKNQDKELDNFVKNLKNYNKLTFKDNKKSKIDADPVILYTDNLVNNHYLYLENYKGIYLINKKDNIKNINLFKQDVYKNNLSILSNEYYITGDYNSDYKFHEFNLINIKNGKKSKITSDNEIALTSYMQGSIDKEIYLFDKSDKKQYRINLKNKTVAESGNTSRGINLYKNGEYVIGSAYDAYKKKLTFTKYTEDNKFNDKEYAKVDKVGNKLSGYYYLYEKDGNGYKVYRVNVQNKDVYTYLFKTTSLETYYYEDYIYYRVGDYIKYYKADECEKTLLKNKEFEFNNSIQFGLYVK